MVGEGTLAKGASAHVWLLAYCGRLREQAAGRQSSDVDGLDLVQERAALAREQRRSYEIKNAVAEGTYAPIGLLAQVLATASQGVVDRFDMLPGQLKKVCPDLPDAARQQVEAAIASARNEWIRATGRLVVESMGVDDIDVEELPPAEGDGGC